MTHRVQALNRSSVGGVTTKARPSAAASIALRLVSSPLLARASLVVACLFLVGFFLPMTAGARMRSADYANVETTAAPIDSTELVIDYPRHWQRLEFPLKPRLSKHWFEQYPDAAELMGIAPDVSLRELKTLMEKDLKFLVLFAADGDRNGTGDGDNVIVKLYSDSPHRQEPRSMAKDPAIEREDNRQHRRLGLQSKRQRLSSVHTH
jgi:hypothetical protein